MFKALETLRNNSSRMLENQLALQKKQKQQADVDADTAPETGPADTVTDAPDRSKQTEKTARDRVKEKDLEKQGVLTMGWIERVCAEHKDLYNTPELNDKLYLNHCHLRKVASLHTFSELRTLWLHSNALSAIEGLECCVALKSLYVHDNMLTAISGLEQCRELKNLNLSGNCISVVEGLSSCTKLQNLDLSKNRITDITHLMLCPSVTMLNLQENKIEKEVSS